MKLVVVVATVIAVVLVQPVFAGLPLDVYFVLDRSQSVGGKGWRTISEFVNQTQSLIADYTDGYYQSTLPSEDGLRVGVITFANNNQNEVIFDITGDKTTIDSELTTLGDLGLGGKTLLQPALNDLITSISNTITDIENPPIYTRPKAVLLITDGAVDDENAIVAPRETLLGLDGVTTFSIGIDVGNKGQKQLENFVSGDLQRKFDIDSTDSISLLVGLIAGIILNQASVTFDETQELCFGHSTNLTLSGQSLGAVHAEDVNCYFSRDGIADDVVSVAHLDETGAGWCELPVIYNYTESGEDFIQDILVSVKVNDPSTGLRPIGNQFSFTAKFSNCLNFQSSIQQADSYCHGDPIVVSATDDSDVVGLLYSHGVTILTGHFMATAGGPDLYTRNCVLQGGAFSCTGDEWYAIENELADAAEFLSIDTTQLPLDAAVGRDTGYFVLVKDLHIGGTFDPTNCYSGVLDDDEVCWRAGASGTVTGSHLDAINSKSQLSCRVGESGVAGTIEGLGSDQFRCAFPVNFTDVDGGITRRNTNVEVRLAGGATLFTVPLQLTVDPCIGITNSTKTCLGFEAELDFQGESATILAREGEDVTSKLKCVFFQRDSDATTETDVAVLEDDTMRCIAPASIGDLLGVVFSTVHFLYGDTVVLERNLDVVVESCFDFFLNDEEEKIDDKLVGLEGCWGDDGHVVRFTGASVTPLQESNLECLFDGTLSEPATFQDGAFTCSIPQEVFMGEPDGSPYTTELEILVNGSVGTVTTVTKTVSTVASMNGEACVSTTISNADPSRQEGVFCWGDTILFGASGLVPQRFAQEHSEAVDITCKLVGIPGTTTYTHEDGCALPTRASRNLKQKSRYELEVQVDGEAILTYEVPLFDLQSSTQCVQFDGPNANGNTYCLGGNEEPVYVARGEVINTAIAVGESLQCRWEGGSGPANTSAVVGADSLTCESPPWTPWIDPNTGNFSSLSLMLVESDSALAENELPTPDVCMDAVHALALQGGGRRRLKRTSNPDCWPSCCLSGNNDMYVQGESIQSLTNNGVYNATCSYSGAGGAQLTVVGGVDAGAQNQIVCSRPAWEPFISTQVFKPFSVLDISVNSKLVKHYDLVLETEYCVAAELNDVLCQGEDFQVVFDGHTLDTVLDWVQEDPSTRVVECAIVLAGESSSVAMVTSDTVVDLANKQVTCARTSNAEEATFFQGSSMVLQVVDMSGGNGVNETLTLFDESTNVTYASKPECVAAVIDTCEGPAGGNVVLSGRSMVAFDNKGYGFECQFQNATGVSLTAMPTKTNQNGLVSWTCSYSYPAEEEGIKSAELYAEAAGGSPLLLWDDRIVCPTKFIEQPAGEGAEPLSSGGIAGIVIGVLCVLVVVVFIVMKKRRDHLEEQEKKKVFGGSSNMSSKTSSSANGPVEVVVKNGASFVEGQRVEVKLVKEANGATSSTKCTPVNGGEPQAEAGSQEAGSDWGKAVIVGKASNGTYEVQFDDPALGSESGVVEDRIRVPLSDFMVGDEVLVHQPATGSRDQGDATEKEDKSKAREDVPAVITAVEMNDRYTVKYVGDDNVDEAQTLEIGVAGSRIRYPLVLFKEGDVVEAVSSKSSVDGENVDLWQRGVIVEVGSQAKAFVVRFDQPELVEDEQVAESKIRVPQFAVGNIVEAKHEAKNDGVWYRGQISRVNNDNTYSVKYDDGSLVDRHQVPVRDIRRVVYNVDDIVEVMHGSEWHLARVTAKNGNDTCDVTFKENDKLADEEQVIRPYMRKPLVTYSVGDAVKYKKVFTEGDSFQAIWVPATITEVCGGDCYDVSLDDETGKLVQNVGRDLIQPAFHQTVPTYGDAGEEELIEVTVEDGSDAGMAAASSGVAEGATSGSPAPVAGMGVAAAAATGASVAATGVVLGRMGKHKSSGTPEDNEKIVKDALTTNFRPPPRHHSSEPDGPGMKPMRLRFKKKPPIDFTELPGNQFEVTLDMTGGLGISLGWTKDSRIIVASFKDLADGDWGPVEACGLVGLKDQLLAINGDSIGGLSFAEVSGMIQRSPLEIKLRFGRWQEDMISLQ